jgi:hypothetical protein
MGDRPWMPMADFVESLRSAGHDVLLDGDREDVLLRPQLPTRVPRAVVALLRWRRAARERLREAAVDEILVWDHIVALLCCAARPRRAEVVWVPSASGGTRVLDRVARAALRRWVNRIHSTWDDHAATDNAARVPGWVVFGNEHTVRPLALAELRARAEVAPPLALVFDARQRDEVAPAAMDALVAACNPSAVWWAGDDEWVRRLGGVPDEAVDAAFTGTPDHRHAQMRDRWTAL